MKQDKALLGYMSNFDDVVEDLKSMWDKLHTITMDLEVNDGSFSRLNTAKQYIASVLDEIERGDK